MSSSEPGPSSLVKANAPPERSLNRQVVLEEDEYMEALSHIIARDFFPSLVHIDATNNYLDALRTHDPALIGASVRRIQELTDAATPGPSARLRRNIPLQTPGRTPWANEVTDTPIAPGEEDLRPSKRPRYDANMSLDKFQARHTSEDNSSFTQILHSENQRRKEKYGWVWDAQRRVEEQKGKLLEAREKMLLEYSEGTAVGVREKLRIEQPKAAGLLTENGEGDAEGAEAEEEQAEKDGEDPSDEASSKQLAVVPTKTEDEVMAKKKDTRPAGVDTWNFKARNSLMFAPDADANPYTSVPRPTSESNRTGPKTIKHTNTRLPSQEESAPTGPTRSEPPSPTRSRIEAAITGTPYRPRSPPSNTTLLPTVPATNPDELAPAAIKQLMTWGTLTATPRILPSEDDPLEEPATPQTPFRIAHPTKREALSHRLASDATKNLKAKASLLGNVIRPGSSIFGSASGSVSRRTGDMGPPSWTPRTPLTPSVRKSEMQHMLTPAARNLLDRTATGIARVRRAEAMGKMSGWGGKSASKEKEKEMRGVRWTPSPAPVSRRES